jgi:hypothetical protein
METQETQAPLAVIHRPTELEGSGWMNVRQAAFRTSCCAATIRKACRAGELRHIRITHRRGPIRTRPEWVDAWLMGGVREPVTR